MMARFRMRNLKRYVRMPWILVWIAAINLIILIYFVILHFNLPDVAKNKSKSSELENKRGPLPHVWSDRVTFILREFEDYENRISKTVGLILSVIPDANIVVIADTLPYPPINISQKAHLVTFDLQPLQSLSDSRPENVIRTEYVIFLPDAIAIKSSRQIVDTLAEFESQPDDVKLLAQGTEPHSHLRCSGLNVNLREWTLEYLPVKPSCDSVDGGDMVILMRGADLFSLSDPFHRPLPDALFLQTALRGWKIVISENTAFQQTERLFHDPHSQWKKKTRHSALLKEAYRHFGIKLVRQADGSSSWFGCSKSSARCFPTVLGSSPEYLARGRWTPPCCQRALRVTARHAVRLLEQQGVRYWLEGGSLLGAARSGDLIPWDYDVDLGIYMEDIPKSFHLTSAQTGVYEDDDGFVWQKAAEGEFYRVQYSATNHLHVDVFPFFSRNGTMTKNTWFKDHPQDCEFPERFLRPLRSLRFLGMDVSVPNNHTAFLELKFGAGVVENPRYPAGQTPAT